MLGWLGWLIPIIITLVVMVVIRFLLPNASDTTLFFTGLSAMIFSIYGSLDYRINRLEKKMGEDEDDEDEGPFYTDSTGKY